MFPQDCTNTRGNFKCSCKEGTKKGQDGTCQEFTPLVCDVQPQKPVIKAIKGNNVKVKVCLLLNTDKSLDFKLNENGSVS